MDSQIDLAKKGILAIEAQARPAVASEREQVACDDDCGALTDPVTIEEWRAAAEHWQGHGYLAGCSHGA